MQCGSPTGASKSPPESRHTPAGSLRVYNETTQAYSLRGANHPLLADLAPAAKQETTMKDSHHHLLITAALVASVALGPLAQAQDGESGKDLHDANCVACHGSEVYTRKDHRITDMDALNTQVARCENNLGLQWFEDQRDAVSNYLNDSYYHF
jgi:cytochrome c5